MAKVLSLLWKDNRSRVSLIAGCSSFLTFVFYLITWKTTPHEATEMPSLVILLTLLAAAVLIAACFKNWFHIVNLAGYVLAVAALFVCLAGRVSYLAFYFSGDAMATGLSPMLVITLVLALLTMVGSGMAIFMEKA